jgi:hypothetical protein
MEDTECKGFPSQNGHTLTVSSPIAFIVTRILTQTLSNLVTSNQQLIVKLWDIYMNLPEDQVVLTYAPISRCFSIFNPLLYLTFMRPG